MSYVWWYEWPPLTVYRKCLSSLCGGMDGLYSLQEPSLQSLSPTYGSMNVFFNNCRKCLSSWYGSMNGLIHYRKWGDWRWEVKASSHSAVLVPV